jgi:hypothetical protein
MDRGADCRGVYTLALEKKLLVTVRAKVDRRLQFPDGKTDSLMRALRKQPVAGHYFLDVPKRANQKERTAKLAVRYFEARIVLRLSRKRRQVVQLSAISADEVNAPAGQEPLRWVLLTTRRINATVDALHVVANYSFRWRVEDFHKAWKSGACEVESSQLQARTHLQRWATIMAAVAARIERLKHVARSTPNLPASEEFSQDEIDATIVLRREETNVPYQLGDVPTIGEMTRWIAELGGYMGSRNSPPPGTIVLRRGLEQVTAAATALRALRSSRPTRSGQ